MVVIEFWVLLLSIKNEKLGIRLEKNVCWNKENKIGLKQTRDHFTIKWLEEFLDDKAAFYNDSEGDDSDNDDENYNENIEAVVRKIGVLKNFSNFTGKQLCWSFFLIKLHTLRPATLLKTDSNTGIFFMKLASFLRMPLFTEHLQWPFLKIMNSSSYLRVLSIAATK